MEFKLGDVVDWEYNGVKATIIAVGVTALSDTHYLLGWRENLHGWRFEYGIQLLEGWGKITMLAKAFSYYKRAYWVGPNEIRLEKRNLIEPKSHPYPYTDAYSRVSQRTLQKRIRDQIAQEALSIKG